MKLQLDIRSGTTYAFACIKSYVFSLKISRAVQRNGEKWSLLEKKKRQMLDSLFPCTQPTPPSFPSSSSAKEWTIIVNVCKLHKWCRLMKLQEDEKLPKAFQGGSAFLLRSGSFEWFPGSSRVSYLKKKEKAFYSYNLRVYFSLDIALTLYLNTTTL